MDPGTDYPYQNLLLLASKTNTLRPVSISTTTSETSEEGTCSNTVPPWASVSELCSRIVPTQLLLPPAASSVSPRCNTYRFANAVFPICNTDTAHHHRFTAQRRTCYHIYNRCRHNNKRGFVEYTGPDGISSLDQEVELRSWNTESGLRGL